MKKHYAGFWIRFVAHVIDSIVLNLVAYGLETALLYGFYLAWKMLNASRGGAALPPFSDAFNPLWVQFFGAGVYFCIAFPYFVWCHYRWGTTLGKRPFHIRVVDARTEGAITIRQSIIRFFGYGLSYLPFGAGFVMAGFHPRKQALHDLLAGTVSVTSQNLP